MRNQATGRDVDAVDRDLALLQTLARQYPSLDAALAEIARLAAELTLPKRTTHVISDVHGDDVKLRHVINNASGAIRAMVEALFADRRSLEEIRELLTLIFYPKEAIEQVEPKIHGPEAMLEFARRALSDLFEIVRTLARRRSLAQATKVFPSEYASLLNELLHEPISGRGPEYLDALIGALVRHDRILHVVRLTVHVLRNLAIDELVLAGDCWDRGARGDRVVDTLMHLPQVSFIWGNHDAA